MRVISGEYRGRTLKTIKGDATRPTTDRVKESLMSSVVSACGSFDDKTILDAFAGSGALGIEALSRGAAQAVFCEKANNALRVIEENIALLKIPSNRFRVIRGDVTARLDVLSRYTFDVVFLDPPYALSASEVMSFVKGLDLKGALSSQALICYEYAKTNKPDVLACVDALELQIVSHKDYGETSLILLRKES